MGDRVYASITFGGHIGTVEEMELFVEALGIGYLRDEEERYINNGADAKKLVRQCIENGEPPKVCDDNCNYGEFDDLEAMVSKIPGLGCVTEFEAGGGFDAGTKTIMPDGSECRGYFNRDESTTVSLTAVSLARQSDDVLAALDKIIEDAHNASGFNLPPFTVSPAVAAWLKIFAEKAA